MKFQVERTQNYYNESEKGIELLSREAQFAIYSACRIYIGILDKIMKNDFNPFKGRAYVPIIRKFLILIDEFIRKRFFPIFQQ